MPLCLHREILNGFMHVLSWDDCMDKKFQLSQSAMETLNLLWQVNTKRKFVKVCCQHVVEEPRVMSGIITGDEPWFSRLQPGNKEAVITVEEPVLSMAEERMAKPWLGQEHARHIFWPRSHHWLRIRASQLEHRQRSLLWNSGALEGEHSKKVVWYLVCEELDFPWWQCSYAFSMMTTCYFFWRLPILKVKLLWALSFSRKWKPSGRVDIVTLLPKSKVNCSRFLRQWETTSGSCFSSYRNAGTGLWQQVLDSQMREL